MESEAEDTVLSLQEAEFLVEESEEVAHEEVSFPHASIDGERIDDAPSARRDSRMEHIAAVSKVIRGMPSGKDVGELRRALKDMGFPEEREDREFELGLFLKGSGGSVRKAAEVYSKTLQWRKTCGADNIRQAVRSGRNMHPSTFPCSKSIMQAWPHQLVSIDCWCRDGQPFSVSRIGLFDLKRMSTSVSMEHFELYMIYTMEARLWRIEQLSRSAGRLLQYLDVHDFTSKNKVITKFGSSMTYLKRVVGLSAHYPEQVHGILLVNMPRLARAFWGLARMVVPEGTRSKIDVVDLSNESNFLTLEVVEPHLPYFLGGRLDALLTSKEAYELRMLFAEDIYIDLASREPEQFSDVPVALSMSSSLSYAEGDDEEENREPTGGVYESPVRIPRWHGRPLFTPSQQADQEPVEASSSVAVQHKALGLQQWQRSIDLGSAVVDRGYPDGDRGYPDGDRGYPDGDRGYPDGDRGYPDGDLSFAPTETHTEAGGSGSPPVSESGDGQERKDETGYWAGVAKKEDMVGCC